MSTTEKPAIASGVLNIGGELPVYRMGFGAMRITGDGIWGPPKDKAEALAVLRRTLDLGINLIDTADSYGPYVSEELIAEALYPYPAGLVIATKGGLLRTGPGQWPIDGSPKHLREAIEGSLKRLKVDCIDVYQFHRPDPKVPFEDSVGEVAKFREEGKVRFVGLSNVTPDELARAQKIVPIVSVQNRYNLVDREGERMDAKTSEELVDICERQNIGFIPWNPLLTGNLARPGSPLEKIAEAHDASPSQIAVAWLLKRSKTILPIPGTSSVKHLEENTQGATIKLTDEEFETINQLRKA
jgi:aryl-alcohol dehydrogenase-like predicted oxidoreductase